MILFRSCPRCGGDVDTTSADDVYCVQCAHRMEISLSGPLVAEQRSDSGSGVPSPVGSANPDEPVAAEARRSPPPVEERPAIPRCPRCGSGDVVRLEKIDPEYNTCLRCRLCGHVFSPRQTGARRTPDGSEGHAEEVQ